MALRCFRTAFSLGLTLLSACADDVPAADAGCAQPGERASCNCTNGATGSQLCLADGMLTTCDCDAVRTLPCSAPGVAFDCRCSDDSIGIEICRDDGRYTPCDCGSNVQPTDAAVALPDADAGGTPAPLGCPTSFTCTEQMGVRGCVDGSGLPPLCGTTADCAGEGLPDATCVDPMIGGVLVCYQPC